MKIPAIRERLHELADELDCPELHHLADETKRRPMKRPRVATDAKQLTEEQKEEARKLYLTRGVAMYDIALLLGTNTGRVSEAINGFRE